MQRLVPNCLVFLLLVIGGLLPTTVKGGGESQPIGARRVGLGFAYAGVRGDFWSMYMNPAGIAGITQMEVGSFVERRFLLEQLNLGAVGFAMPFNQNKHFAGFDIAGFGFGGYNEARIGLTYATTLLERISVGAKVNYTRFSIQNYGAKSALYADLGLNCILSKHLSLGFRISNASRSQILKDQDEQIPTIMDLGLAYKVSDKVLIVADVQKQVNFPVSFRGGMEYGITKFLRARIGASTQPVTMSAGIGLDVKGIQIDIANNLHQYLGYTPSLSIGYKFGKQEEAQ